MSSHRTGDFGEQKVKEKCACPRCKRAKTFEFLRKNFKCADIICNFCGYIAQIKTTKVTDLDVLPNTITGSGWKVFKDRLDSGIYFPLFLVLSKSARRYAIYYLPSDLQNADMFKKRNELSITAKRPGWIGFTYKLTVEIRTRFVRLV